MWDRENISKIIHQILEVFGIKESNKKTWVKILVAVFFISILLLLGLAEVFNVFPGFREYVPFAQEKDKQAIKKEEESRLKFYYNKRVWLGEVTDESTGIIKTTFELHVHIPPFFTPKNPEKFGRFVWLGDLSTKCEFSDQPIDSSVLNNGVTSSSTLTYKAECETYKPIIDNARLFEFKEE